jgi:hypothetical protein
MIASDARSLGPFQVAFTERLTWDECFTWDARRRAEPKQVFRPRDGDVGHVDFTLCLVVSAPRCGRNATSSVKELTS